MSDIIWKMSPMSHPKRQVAPLWAGGQRISTQWIHGIFHGALHGGWLSGCFPMKKGSDLNGKYHGFFHAQVTQVLRKLVWEMDIQATKSQ